MNLFNKNRKTVNVGDKFVFAREASNPFDKLIYEVMEIQGGWARYDSFFEETPRFRTKGSKPVLDFINYYVKIN